MTTPATTFADNNQAGRNPELGAWVTLRSVVMGAIRRTGDHSMNEYWELLQFGIDFIREKLSLFHEASVEVGYFTPNAAGIITWPSDMVDYVKIGIPDANGNLWTLTVNNEMILNRGTLCGVDIRQINTANAVNVTGGFPFADHFRDGVYISGLYGIGGGFNSGYFRIDKKMRQIQFNGINLSEIIMEYKTTGIGPGTLVAPQAIASVRTFILAERADCDPRMSASERERLWEKHDKEIQYMRDFNLMPKMAELKDVLWGSYKQSPKR